MSFQDMTGGGASVRQFRNLQQRDAPRRMHSIETSQPAASSRRQMATYNGMQPTQMQASRPRRSMIVLHGRVQQQEETDDEYDDGIEEAPSNNEYSSIRTVMERKSIFSKLSHETQIFGRMVADLEELLAESGESPEAAWRARILMRSAQETDKELWNKLFSYEKSLHGAKQDSELRHAQTACMKLHRDFKRIHKSLVLALSLFEKRQKAEVSRLGAVGWSTGIDSGEEDPPKIPNQSVPQPVPYERAPQQAPPVPVPQEDYFDRVMREREAFNRSMREQELTQINQKMQEVSAIYNDLAQVVDVQQEKIDDLEKDAEYAKYKVKSAEGFSWDFLMCTTAYEDHKADRRRSKKSSSKLDIDWPSLFACGDISEAAEALKDSYGILYDEGSSYRGTRAEGSVRSETSDSDESPIAVDPPKIERNSRKSSKKSGRSKDFDPKRVEEKDSQRKSSRRSSQSRQEDTKTGDSNFTFYESLESLAEDVKAIHSDLVGWGQGMVTPKNCD